MAYEKAKVYFDGGHYIAIPKEHYQHSGRKNAASKQEEGSPKQKFEQAFEESKELPKKERKEYIQAVMQDSFSNSQETTDFVQQEMERKRANSNKRKTRLYRKVFLQEWNYFVTITYDDKLHNEDSFRIKLKNTLKHLVSRKEWKYIGVFERSPENRRLHFHAIMYIPQMIGELVQAKDYSTKTKRMQVTNQNTHFLKQFGRNDFQALGRREEILFSVRYLLKYIEKSNEKLIYGGKLPTYFVADIDDDDVVCPIGNGDKKALLFDDFTLWDEWCLVGKVDKETIKQMPKAN